MQEQRTHLWEKLRCSVNERQGFPSHNRIHLLEIGMNYYKGELLVTQDSLNALGYVHGGGLVALADRWQSGGRAEGDGTL